MDFIEWHRKLGRPECPYIHRWAVNFGLFSVRLHHFLRSDDNRALHDHPSWYCTLILKGEYDDVTNIEKNEFVRLKPGNIAFRKAEHKHTVRTNGVWTLVVFGRAKQKWGFYPKNKYIRALKYFYRHGHHPCEQL